MYSLRRVLLVKTSTGIRGWSCLVDERSAIQRQKASLALSYVLDGVKLDGAFKSDMVDLTVPWRSIFSLVVPNWFRCNEAANDYIRVSSALVGSPPRNSSTIPVC